LRFGHGLGEFRAIRSRAFGHRHRHFSKQPLFRPFAIVRLRCENARC
jgi:hypothetical protein